MSVLGQTFGEDKISLFCDFFAYLYARWQDEREYEDFEEYKQAVSKNFFNYPIMKFTKRPWQVYIDTRDDHGFIACFARKGEYIHYGAWCPETRKWLKA